MMAYRQSLMGVGGGVRVQPEGQQDRQSLTVPIVAAIRLTGRK